MLARRALAGLFLALFALALPATGQAARKPVKRLFSPSSVWNAPVSSRHRVDPTSRPLVRGLYREARREIRAGTGPWIAETSYSTPLYTVGAGQRRVGMQIDAGAWKAPLAEALDAGVPIPRRARPAKGTDGHLTIYQPSTDTLWEFWRAVRKADGWHASWGGAMRHVSKSPGYFNDRSWTGLTTRQGWNWGSTATSLPVIAGTVRIAELRRGRIDHALAIALPDACAKVFTWPAQRTDGTEQGKNCIPEGAHLRLDPRVDLKRLKLPRITRILARAAQRYGMIVRDRTHHAIGFYAEDPSRLGHNPYAGASGLYGGLRPWNFLPQFPWHRLQLLPMSLCRQAPCRAHRR